MRLERSWSTNEILPRKNAAVGHRLFKVFRHLHCLTNELALLTIIKAHPSVIIPYLFSMVVFDKIKLCDNMLCLEELKKIPSKLSKKIADATKLHPNAPDGYDVGQGYAAISEGTILTGGLLTCTGLVITTTTHNFVCHIDSYTDQNWLVESIKEFIKIGGDLTEIAMYNNPQGKDLNKLASSICEAALNELGIINDCKQYNITGFHSIGAKRVGTEGPRAFTFLGKLSIS